jgi:uncharacterized membrane protein
MSTLERYLIKFGSFVIRHWLTIMNVMLFLFIVPIVLSPYFMSTGNAALVTIGGWILSAYHPTCHQLPDRSLFIFGYQMAVCSRCFAIYAGFLAGGLSFYFLKNKLKPFHILYFVLFCVPMGIDGVAQLFGIPIPRSIGPGLELVWSTVSNNEMRVFTGAIFGLGGALFAMPYLQHVLEMEEETEKEKSTARDSGRPD